MYAYDLLFKERKDVNKTYLRLLRGSGRRVHRLLFGGLGKPVVIMLKKQGTVVLACSVSRVEGEGWQASSRTALWILSQKT